MHLQQTTYIRIQMVPLIPNPLGLMQALLVGSALYRLWIDPICVNRSKVKRTGVIDSQNVPAELRFSNPLHFATMADIVIRGRKGRHCFPLLPIDA